MTLISDSELQRWLNEEQENTLTFIRHTTITPNNKTFLIVTDENKEGIYDLSHRSNFWFLLVIPLKHIGKQLLDSAQNYKN